MSSSAEWWFRSRGRLPRLDYQWVDGDGRVASPPLDLAAIERLSVGGTLTLYCGWLSTPARTLVLFVDGLSGSNWPRDHQGRRVELSVLGIARDADGARQLAAVARRVHGSGADAGLRPVLRFIDEAPGFLVQGNAWRTFAEQADEAEGTPGPGSFLDVTRWMANLHGSPWGRIAAPQHLVVVSEAIDDEWCARNQPVVAEGAHVQTYRARADFPPDPRPVDPDGHSPGGECALLRSIGRVFGSRST